MGRYISQTRAVFVVARICLGIGLAVSGSILPALATEVIKVPIASGPCEPTWKSLGDHFRQPNWWREAKIGMWLHWGPQSVGEDGDWYAKWIYMPKHAWGGYTRVYPHHLERVGHPSETGYKDMLLRWKAEKWDPDKLMALYKRAGARYVIAQGMHHDNFDLWNSKCQPWNSVKLGPHRDIVAGWKKAADREGIRFGIAFHGDYSLWWYQPAFLADLEGPRKGSSLRRCSELRRQGDLVEEFGARSQGPLRHRPPRRRCVSARFQRRSQRVSHAGSVVARHPRRRSDQAPRLCRLVCHEMDSPRDRRHRPILARLHLLRRRRQLSFLWSWHRPRSAGRRYATGHCPPLQHEYREE